MRPSALKKGMAVRRKTGGHVFKFQFRHNSKCRCICDEYIGLNGPDDDGRVDVSDWEMSRHFELINFSNKVIG